MLPHVVTRLQRLAQLESQFQETLEHEKLESLRQFAYGASHEINNPLANISTRAQTLLREETNPERRRKLATINAQAFRAHRDDFGHDAVCQAAGNDPGRHRCR